jgi:two-component system response regulator MprA
MSALDGPGGPKRRLLIVEDDPALRELYEEVLSGEGFAVVTARDGLEAFERFLADGPFDALIVDQDMPRLDGKALLKRLRGLGEGAPAILVSGRLEVDASEGESLGLGAWLDKPFSRDALLRAIRKLIPA